MHNISECPGDRCRMVQEENVTACAVTGWIHTCVAESCTYLVTNTDGCSCKISSYVYDREYSVEEQVRNQGFVISVRATQVPQPMESEEIVEEEMSDVPISDSPRSKPPAVMYVTTFDDAHSTVKVSHIRVESQKQQNSFVLNTRVPVDISDYERSKWYNLLLTAFDDLCLSSQRLVLNQRVETIMEQSIQSALRLHRGVIDSKRAAVFNMADVHCEFWLHFKDVLVRYSPEPYRAFRAQSHWLHVISYQTYTWNREMSQIYRVKTVGNRGSSRVVYASPKFAYSERNAIIASLYLMSHGVRKKQNPAEWLLPPWPRIGKLLPPMRSLSTLGITTNSITSHYNKIQSFLINNTVTPVAMYCNAIECDSCLY